VNLCAQNVALGCCFNKHLMPLFFISIHFFFFFVDIPLFVEHGISSTGILSSDVSSTEENVLALCYGLLWLTKLQVTKLQNCMVD
jgi:hypothetical protein